MAELNFKFMRNPFTGASKQEEFFFLTCRNQCFSGAYGNGKSYIGCMKAISLLTKFPNYRMAILRASSTDLRRTTQSTFFKICLPEFYNKGGNRVDSMNYLRLNNGSEVYWLHLDEYDESLVKGLELNSYLIDQAEEIDENIYLHLDARLDRWDQAMVPEELNPERFPKNPATGKPKPPAYGMILCNPDAKTHWIYQRYHPDSPAHHQLRETVNPYTGEVKKYRYSDTHKMIQATSYDNPALSPETLAQMESRGEDFRKRFVLGEWGRAGGAIHNIDTMSRLVDVPDELLRSILMDGRIFMALDHGDASPTACVWVSVYKGWMFVFREYYKAKTLISEHRKNIAVLNQNPDGYYFNTVSVCDPSMLNKTQQKKGGLFSLADEYATSEYIAPPIHFMPADNNEFLTRSRINEVLRIHPNVTHPVTGKKNAPVLYFLEKTPNFPHGCYHVLSETESQKYEKLGVLDGEDVYGDERESSVDHAYDALRYAIACIYQYQVKPNKQVMDIDNTFRGAREKAVSMQRKWKRLAGVHPRSIGCRL